MICKEDSVSSSNPLTWGAKNQERWKDRNEFYDGPDCIRKAWPSYNIFACYM